jgi:hypothetical protein
MAASIDLELLQQDLWWTQNYTNTTKFPIKLADTSFLILCTALVMVMTPAIAHFYGGNELSSTLLN